MSGMCLTELAAGLQRFVRRYAAGDCAKLSTGCAALHPRLQACAAARRENRKTETATGFANARDRSLRYPLFPNTPRG